MLRLDQEVLVSRTPPRKKFGNDFERCTRRTWRSPAEGANI